MFFWLMCVGMAILKTKLVNKWLGIAGLLCGLAGMYGNLVFFGAPGAFAVNRFNVDLVAVWMIILGINLVSIRRLPAAA